MTRTEIPRPESARPVIRIRPKKGGRFFAGAPWVYVDELVLDRRSKGLEPGVIARLEDNDRQPLGAVAVNVNSMIAVRLLDRDPEAVIDVDWFIARLSRALALRERLYDEPFYRLVHAEADGLPGLVIDRFGDAIAVQPNAAWTERFQTPLLEALDKVLAPKTIVWNGQSRARQLEGLSEELQVIKGALDAPIPTPMNSATYQADLTGGQKTGLFFDQRETHAFVAKLAKDRSVLDVFSHVGGFSLAALAAGASSAIAIDGSAPALELAVKGAEASSVADRFESRRGDAFDVMKALQDEDKKFDVVVCDPPAFAPNKAAVEAGLRAYRRAARLGINLTAPGGVFTLCSCSHAVGAAELETVVGEAMRRFRRSGRLLRGGGAGPDHPVHPALPETRYLKTLVYEVD